LPQKNPSTLTAAKSRKTSMQNAQAWFASYAKKHKIVQHKKSATLHREIIFPLAKLVDENIFSAGQRILTEN